MATSKTTSQGGLVKQTQGMFNVNPMSAPQLEQLWKEQDSLLKEAGSYAQG